MPDFRFPPLWDDPWAIDPSENEMGGSLAGLLEPPEYEERTLAGAPPLGFRERLALGLQDVPQYRPSFGESGGSAFARGLIGGAARSFSSSGLTRMQRGDDERKEQNAVNRAAADRAWQAKWGTYTVRLRDQLERARDKEGNVTITAELDEAMGKPGLVGKAMKPNDVAGRVQAYQARQQAQKNSDREFSLDLTRERRLASDGGQEKSADESGIRWTKAGAANIAAKQREYEAALTRAYGDVEDPDVKRAALSRDNARKSDVAGQIRMARSMKELDAIAEKIEAFYPAWVSEQGAMIPTVMRDKVLEFRSRTTGRTGAAR